MEEEKNIAEPYRTNVPLLTRVWEYVRFLQLDEGGMIQFIRDKFEVQTSRGLSEEQVQQLADLILDRSREEIIALQPSLGKDIPVKIPRKPPVKKPSQEDLPPPPEDLLPSPEDLSHPMGDFSLSSEDFNIVYEL